MTIQEDAMGNKFVKSLDELKPEYGVKKVTNLLQFYKLSGRKSALSLENLVPLTDVPYLLYSPQEDIYYLKTFRNYDCEHLYWYRRTLTFTPEHDKEVDNFRRYAEDGMLSICFDKYMAEEIASMLKRLWKANLSGEGQLDYRLFYELLDQYLKYEDYKSYGQELTGYKTLCRQFDEKIAELWKRASEKKK